MWSELQAMKRFTGTDGQQMFPVPQPFYQDYYGPPQQQWHGGMNGMIGMGGNGGGGGGGGGGNGGARHGKRGGPRS